MVGLLPEHPEDSLIILITLELKRIPFKINKGRVVQLFYGHPICQVTLLPKRLRSQLALHDPGFTDQYDQRRYGSSRSEIKMVGKMKQPEMHPEKFVYNQRVRNLILPGIIDK